MGRRKEYTGTVISAKMQKTVVVKVMQLSKHAKYGRVLKRSIKFKVHDEKGIAKVGDTVRIIETRPLSKDKYFMLGAIVKKAPVHHLELKEEIK